MDIPRKDIKRQTFKSGGPGGQHKNKVETAIRLTHIPTGIVSECSDERKQGQNEKKAYERLVAKLEARDEARRAESRQEAYHNKPEVCFGGQQIRTYKLCGNDAKVTDHRTGVTANPQKVLNGGIDRFLIIR